MKPDNCRIIITEDCNLACDFCCMKDKELVKKFLPKTIKEIAVERHKEYKITGGEPLLCTERVLLLTKEIRDNNPKCLIYLYTNGILLTEDIAENFKTAGGTALTVSPHQHLNRRTLITIHRTILPIRIRIGKIEKIADWNVFCGIHEMLLVIWDKGDCYKMLPEGRYYVEGT